MIEYLSLAQILHLHEAQIDAFGGAGGIRDKNGLESAVARPTMTFAGEDLYPDVAAKAAALMHSLVLNHPFVDGNKRVGAAAAELMALLNGYELNASDDELEDLTLSVAKGEMDIEPLTIWLRQHVVRAD